MSALFPEVTVNGETIPPAAIALEAQNHPAPSGKPGLAWRAAARALVVRALLLQAARAAGLEAAPRELGNGKVETGEDALIRAFLDEAVEPAPISEEDCARAYASRAGQFRSPDLFEASHILIAAPPEDDAARKAARESAQDILRKLQAAPDSFEHHARGASDCSSAGQGGRLGQLRPGDTVPQFEAVLTKLEEGRIWPEPVESRFGFHIIRLDHRAEGRPLPYEAVRGEIREALEKAAWARAARALVEGLVARAEITGIDMAPAGAPAQGAEAV
jgi:peptidyl-prolyl cis-trans isomerase C